MDYSAKENAQFLRQLAKQKGIQNIVFSPGSRNAPLVIELANDADLSCTTVPDERTAGFVALGQAISSGKPSILVCTSGSALLNYYPAVAEAFYQKVPLIVASADRPTEWVDQLDGQTIRQNNVFANHILYSTTLFKDGGDVQTSLNNQRVINEAINCAIDQCGPVHLNFPFTEPLYETTSELVPAKNIHSYKGKTFLAEDEVEKLSSFWNAAKKKIVLVGQLNHNVQLESLLEKLCNDDSTVIFTETIANSRTTRSFNSIDRLMDLSPETASLMKPEILLTIGNAFVSKKVKAFLRNNRPQEHWHLSIDQNHPDTFQSLTHAIKIAPEVFLEQFVQHVKLTDGNYHDQWARIAEKRTIAHERFCEALDYCDLLVYKTIVENLKPELNVHWANSTAIRYAQLFDYHKNINHFCNRGTSGIEGSTSTAVGFAVESKKPTVVITGDISFFYDANAFFNDHFPQNLKVIVVNNSGGGIFRFIPGPGTTNHLESVFESKHHANVQGIAQAHNISYSCVTNKIELMERLPLFFADATKAEILEIKTPDVESADILKQYFKAIING